MNDDIKNPEPAPTAPDPKQPDSDTASLEAVTAPIEDDHLATGELSNIKIDQKIKAGDKKGKVKKSPLEWFKSKSKRQKIIMSVAAPILLIGFSAAVWFGFLKPDAPVAAPEAPQKVEVVEPPKPVTEASRLTGVQITPEQNKLPTTAVMLENSPDARPQSGLLEAGVVFEAIAEGGITRFLAIFQESKPAQIGPVRSVRPYYLDWLVPFDAPIAHAGGSPEALAQVRSQGIKDLDQFANPGAYQRAPHRYSPHNLYTTRDQLLDLQNSKGFGSSDFVGFTRKPIDSPVTVPTAKTIDLSISSYNYNVHYDYNATTNSYDRIIGGAPHLDEQSGKQLSPKVVIAMVIPYNKNGIYSVYGTNGSGAAYFFQDGVASIGTWTKANRASQIVFTNSDGVPSALNPGQTWITMLAGADLIAHSP